MTFPSGVTVNEPGNDNVCESCHKGRAAKADVDAAIAAGKPALAGRPPPPGRRGQARLGGPRRVRVPGQDLRRRAVAHRGDPVHLLPRSRREPPHLRGHGRLERPLQRLPRRRERRPQEHPRHPHARLRRRRRHHGAAGRRDRRSGGGPRWRRCRRRRRRRGSVTRPTSTPSSSSTRTATRPAAPPRLSSPTPLSAWTPALTKAALNFQLSQNDPGSWAHNFDYTAELLYDSTQDLGGNVSKLRRP